MIKVIYNKVCGRCVQSEPLTSGMVGQPIHFEYSHDFDGLAVTAVFTDGKNTVDVVNPGNECIIPHEVLTTVGAIVKVGIYAVKGDKLVIPTIYAHIGVVLKGADPSGDVSIDPTLPIWAQTQALIGNLSELETQAKENLVDAVNEVKQTADRKANAADLTPVATSGSYSDLTDKPTIPSVPTATIEANAAARHTHDNKTLLDSITEALKTAWNTASEWVSTNGANVLSHLADGVKHITANERSAWNDKQDKLIAGENITIAADGKTISATGGGGGGSTVELDTTLSKVGKAADAKAVGDALAGKQDTINDLEAIRTGAAKGATALQSVPSTYRTASEQDTIDSGKVDKVTGKGLSSNDYTDAAKAKVDALAPVATSGNYNDLSNKPTIPSVPKPLTYDYMPEGYPTKTMGTVTLMEEQVVEFVSSGDGSPSVGVLTTTFTPVEGQTYIVNWDGAEYECVCSIFNGRFLVLGNLSIVGSGDDTGEPFIYLNVPSMGSEFETFDTSPSHTISVKKMGEIVIPMANDFLPLASEDNYGAVKKSEIVTSYKFGTQVPHDQMVEAIAAFRTGNASIVWGKNKVISASYNSSDDTISIRFAEEPLKTLTFTNNNGAYVKNVGSTTYGELQGNQVRIFNDNNDYTVLSAEGESPNVTLSTTAKRISIGGVYGISTTEMILQSSTSGSTKKFKIAVDDSGTISATEVTT